MALVLKAKTARNGEVKSFNVVRAEEGTHEQILQDINEGEYHVIDGDAVKKYAVSYRTVQDTVPVP